MKMSSRNLVLALALVTLTGCGASMGAATSPVRVDQIEAELDSLRSEQMKLLFSYDTAMSGGQDQCKALCRHHSKICALADRICAIAERHKQHPRAEASCAQANKTCRDVTQRLPQECWCRDQ